MKHWEHGSWSADIADWHVFKMVHPWLSLPIRVVTSSCICLPRESTLSPTLGAERAMDPTPLDQSPLWLHQDSIHWKEPYLPFQRWWWAGCGLLRLGTARVNRRVRGRAQYRLTYPWDTVLLGEGRWVRKKAATGNRKEKVWCCSRTRVAGLEANACVRVWMESGGGGDLVCKEDQKNEHEIG